MRIEISKSDLFELAYQLDFDPTGELEWDDENEEEIEVQAFRGLHPAYSGRGMYGRTCLGVSAGLGKTVQLLIAIFEKQGMDVDDAIVETAETLDSAARDSLGYDTVYYFSGITVK